MSVTRGTCTSSHAVVLARVSQLSTRARSLPSQNQNRSCFLLRFGASAKVVHFLGSTKPWNYTYDPQTGSVSEEGSGSVPWQQASFLNLWWAIYHRSILPLYGSVRGEEEGTSPGHTVRGRVPRKLGVDSRASNVITASHGDRWVPGVSQ